MKVSISSAKGVITAKLSGEFDHHNAQKIKEVVEEKIREKGFYNLIVDLSELDFMDSSGIGFLMGRYKLLAPLGGSVSVIAGGSNVERIVKMSGLEKFINIYKSKDEAYKNVSGGKKK